MKKAKVENITGFIQIAPIENWWAEYSDEFGSKFYRKIVALALSNDGVVHFLDSDDHGLLEDAWAPNARIFYSLKNWSDIDKE